MHRAVSGREGIVLVGHSLSVERGNVATMKQKSLWLDYAHETLLQIDDRCHRKGWRKVYERIIHSSYQIACTQKGFRGSFAEWNAFIRKLDGSRGLGRGWG